MSAKQGIRWPILLLGWLRCLTLLLTIAVYLVLADARPAWATDSEVPDPLAEALSQALAEWAEFASTGDFAALESGFAEAGPQRRQLEAESIAWTDDGGSEPLRFIIRELRLRGLGFETATVWARVEVTRTRFEPRLFSWDFDLVLRGGRWRVWTVVAAQPPDLAPPVSHVAAETPAISSSTTTTSLSESGSEPRKLAASPPAEAKSPAAGVRLPVMSAWIIVITIVGVALAGYLAPRIDRRGER